MYCVFHEQVTAVNEGFCMSKPMVCVSESRNTKMFKSNPERKEIFKVNGGLSKFLALIK